MKNNISNFAVADSKAFKIKMLNWSSRFNIFCFLDNSHYDFESPSFECMLAVGCERSITLKSKNAFETLKQFSLDNPGWLFGHFNYPSKNRDESQNDLIGFEDGFFFIPQMVLQLSHNNISIESAGISANEIFSGIDDEPAFIKNGGQTKVDIKCRYTREAYIEIIRELKKHILRGDCYEINFCQDFYSVNAEADPLFLYHELISVSPNTFAAFYKLNDKYCLCASPERFLKKKGNKLISQPIKGTSKRNLTEPVIDEQNKNYLINSPKEKSENVMVVDLVRNDMSRVCKAGSVFVSELFGIYSFPQVHQMISTVEGEVQTNTHWTDIIKACFPMGSMTGAPKIKVMELIDEFETVPRGLFSGTIGYVTPEEDFDFNVVIRSLFYNEARKTLSFKAGSGITFNSDPSDEFDECMMKAAALVKILQTDFL